MGIVVGTSSWADPGFVEKWYPPGLAARDRLGWYAERFEGVEVNSTFYAIPGRATVERWVAVTPGGFTFDVKLHRLLSRHAAPLDSLPPDLRDGAATTGRGRVALDARLEVRAARHTARGGRAARGRGPPRDLPAAALARLRATRARARRARAARGAPRAAPRRRRAAPPRLDAPEAPAAHARLARRPRRRVGRRRRPAGRPDHIMPPIDAVTRPGLAYLRMHGRNTDGYLRGGTVAERFGWRYSDAELEGIRARAVESRSARATCA